MITKNTFDLASNKPCPDPQPNPPEYYEKDNGRVTCPNCEFDTDVETTKKIMTDRIFFHCHRCEHEWNFDPSDKF